MIRINLLPEELRGRQSGGRSLKPKREGPSMLVLMVLVLMGLSNIYGFVLIHGKRGAVKHESSKLRSELDALEKNIEDNVEAYAELKALEKTVDTQIAVLRQLDPPNRVYWSEKLNMLAELVPPDAFITELSLDEQVDQVETPASIKARQDWEKLSTEQKTEIPAPIPVTLPQIYQTLSIIGFCTGENANKRFKNVLDFQDDLMDFFTDNNRNDRVRFMKGFANNVDGDAFDAARSADRDTFTFAFRVTTLPPPPLEIGTETDAQPARDS